MFLTYIKDRLAGFEPHTCLMEVATKPTWHHCWCNGITPFTYVKRFTEDDEPVAKLKVLTIATLRPGSSHVQKGYQISGFS